MVRTNSDTDERSIGRRKFLRTAGLASVALASPVIGTSAAESQSAQKLSPSTAEIPDLEDVTVRFYDNGDVNVVMGGTRSKNEKSSGFRVNLINTENKMGKLTPERASASVSSIQESEYLRRETNSKAKSTDSNGGSGTKSSTQSISPSAVGSGGDNESDREGGVWIRTKDPANLDLALTQQWIRWTTSGGEVDWAKWNWETHAYEIPLVSDWNIGSSGHSNTSFPDSTVQSKVYGNYYNWTWSYNDNKTTTHHRLWAIGYGDGSLDWYAEMWSNGEDSHLLHYEGGTESNYSNE